MRIRGGFRGPGTSGWTFALLLWLSGCREEPPPPPPEPPHEPVDPYRCEGCNVVLISIDTLRADHLGCYGYPRDTSPAIDAFAEEGLVFERAMSQSAWTTPAHASMMTGQLPSEHGLLYYKTPGVLPEELDTLAEIFKRNGYRTAGFHGDGYVSKDFGLAQGFDTYRSDGRLFPNNLPNSIAWLREQGERKFFLFLHGFDVHRPYNHRELNTFFDYEGSSELDVDGFCVGPDSKRDAFPVGSRPLQYMIAQYDAGIRFADRQVGRVLRYLRESGLLDRTIVVITSDHGDGFFEHGRCDHTRTMYSEVIHVPLILRTPTGLSGRVDRPVAASISLLPTLTRMTGVGSQSDARFDLMQMVRDAEHSQLPFVSETGARNPGHYYWSAVFDDTYKLVYHARAATEARPATRARRATRTRPAIKARPATKARPAQQRYELYDWRRDPDDWIDIALEHPAEVAAMKALVPGHASGSAPEPTTASKEQRLTDETLREQLKALGYLEDDEED